MQIEKSPIIYKTVIKNNQEVLVDVNAQWTTLEMIKSVIGDDWFKPIEAYRILGFSGLFRRESFNRRILKLWRRGWVNRFLVNKRATKYKLSEKAINHFDNYGTFLNKARHKV